MLLLKFGPLGPLPLCVRRSRSIDPAPPIDVSPRQIQSLCIRCCEQTFCVDPKKIRAHFAALLRGVCCLYKAGASRGLSGTTSPFLCLRCTEHGSFWEGKIFRVRTASEVRRRLRASGSWSYDAEGRLAECTPYCLHQNYSTSLTMESICFLWTK